MEAVFKLCNDELDCWLYLDYPEVYSFCSHILQCFHSEPVWHFAPDVLWMCWQGGVSSLTGLHILCFELFVLWILKQSYIVGMKSTRSLSVSIIENLFVNVNPCNYSIIFFCNFLLIFFFKVKVKSALCDDCLTPLSFQYSEYSAISSV